jgi:hypothetical protein
MTINIGMTGRIKFPNPDELTRAIKKDLFFRAQKAFRKLSPDVKRRVGAIVQQELSSSETTISLLQGTLRDEFGLTKQWAVEATFDIIKYMTSNIDVSMSTKDGNYTIVLSIPPADENFINSVRNSEFSTENGDVPWLLWLLKHGTQVVIDDHRLFWGPRIIGRSGGNMIMIKSGLDPFRVDPDHAGTESDNFITRAILNKQDEILFILEEEVRRWME